MSLNRADIYGMMSDRSVTMQPTSVGGPTQGAVAPSVNQAPQGQISQGASASFTWIGFILALIVLRLLIDFGGKD